MTHKGALGPWSNRVEHTLPRPSFSVLVLSMQVERRQDWEAPSKTSYSMAQQHHCCIYPSDDPMSCAVLFIIIPFILQKGNAGCSEFLK